MTTLEKTEEITPEENAETVVAVRDSKRRPERQAVTVSLPASTLIAAAVAVVAVLVSATLGVLLWMSHGSLADRDAAAADDKHAEQVATDYAVGTATINYQDFNSWVAKLKTNTVPQLANTYDATASKLQQLVVPLKWMSTATPIAAKVDSVSGSSYKVDVFLNLTTTNAQNPDTVQTTVTYSITVDKNSDWKVTDVGGTNAALPLK
ncbi:hypothetical protein [Nocardia sp. NBC_00511]|uniref:hypothetical protein n=1 Tax=Nocardia sp. NBC_00511 TaxID=2903591 RepID=UPI0030E28B61